MSGHDLRSGSHSRLQRDPSLLLQVLFYLPAILVLGVLVGILFMGYTEAIDD